MSLPPSNTAILTVTHLNRRVKDLLTSEIGQVWLSAEISGLSQPTSGHWYFTLKDEHAQVRCAMFRGQNRQVSFRPQQGQQVIVRATLTLYEPRGDYQLVIDSMHLAGDGLLQLQFEQLKQRLAAEGLFAPHLKKALPEPARQLGIVTSSTGAALQDILQILQRREPTLPIVIYPVPVQGGEAPAAIVRALQLANLRAECNVLIVGRGGGSLEDLWSFNDERVARAIFASVIPIVSAVGHETDFTIADLVADVRAPTPSAAAELISRDRFEVMRSVTTLRQRLEMAMDYYLAHRRQRLATYQHRLQQQHPELRLARQQNTLAQLRQQLTDAMQQVLQQKTQGCQHMAKQLMARQPSFRLTQASQQWQALRYRLTTALANQFNQQQQAFTLLAGRLESTSPLATLARGFSITLDAQGHIIKSCHQLQVGDQLHTRLVQGTVVSQITDLQP